MFTIAALYHFAPVADPVQMQSTVKMRCEELEIKGTLLIANEGINGTISGAAANIDSILDFLSSIPEFADLVWKLSTSPEQPFARLKVRLKREIVTMGQP